MINIGKINTFISTLNFILCLIGYPLITTLFLRDVENATVSQSITVPFRASALVLSILVVILNIKSLPKIFNFTFVILSFFWFLWIYRIFYDLFISKSIFLNSTGQLWLYIFFICIPSLLSTSLSYDKINYNKAILITITLIYFILILTLFSNQALIGKGDNDIRIDANVGLNTISFGNIGVMGIYLSLYFWSLKKRKIIVKLVLVLGLLLCIYCALRAGSRGPLISLFFVGLFWTFFKSKNFAKNTLLGFLFCIIITIFFDQILKLLGQIAPVIEIRFRSSLNSDHTEERSYLYRTAWDDFLNNPWFGNHFAIFDGQGNFAYAHNLILDALMALGAVGGALMLYLIIKCLNYSYLMIRSNKNIAWISLLLIHELSNLMVSGSFYQAPIFSALIGLHSVIINRKK